MKKKYPAVFFLLLNALATLQLVWFYLQHVPSALNLAAFEQGRERTPFQYRLLLVPLFRWAHTSLDLDRWAEEMSALPGWFPHAVHPEALVEAMLDTVCVAITGLVIRRIYQASSRTGILTFVAYPGTLILIAATYAFQTTHALRFVYDFPALAFFAVGVYLIFFRRSPLVFAGLFVVATLNRETSLFLLPIYVMEQGVHSSSHTGMSTFGLYLQAVRKGPALLVVLPLGAFWIAWHLFVVRHFTLNASALDSRLLLNLGIAACPIAWPQLLSTGCYLWPLVFLRRHLIPSPVLRVWIWLLPMWLIFMMWYGLILEPRVFGELIPIVVPAVLLIAEATLVRKQGQFLRISSMAENASDSIDWSGREDSNLRPPGPEPGALPG